MQQKVVPLVLSLTLSLLFFGLSTTDAHAYLDPGTGSMILQVLLGGFAGLALVGKLYWHKLLTLFGLRREAGEDEQTEPAAPARSEPRGDR